MNKFIRWYNQNRKMIWITIGIIALIIVVIQLFNYWSKVDNEKKLQQANQTQNMNNVKEYNSVSLDEKQSTITGENLSSNQLSQIEIIDLFIEYCNNQQIAEAYSLLTEDCKQEMYPTEEVFKEAYYNNVFENTKKNVGVENWIDNIYKVNINDNFLATGKYTKENTKQDYITVEEEGDSYKLNINSYIGKKAINRSNEQNGVQIEVIEEISYMDYQIFKLRVTNNTDSTIMLDDKQNIKAMYIEDDNGIQYSAYTHEIGESDLEISARETKEIEIKYYSKYGSEKEISKVVFSRMILGYKTNKPNYNNVIEIEI